MILFMIFRLCYVGLLLIVATRVMLYFSPAKISNDIVSYIPKYAKKLRYQTEFPKNL